MHKAHVFWSFIAVSLGGCAATGGSSMSSVTTLAPPAAVPFSCPVAGTLTRTDTTGGSSASATWQGSDSADPTICRVIATNGRELRLLFGFYPLPMNGGEQDARRAIAGAFSGSAKSVCFQTTEVSGGQGAGGQQNYIFERCWKQIGPTLLDRGTTKISAIAFSIGDEGNAGNYFAGDYTVYYDPATHLFIQRDVVTRRGTPALPWKRYIRTSAS